jgi:hypothetical protein
MKESARSDGSGNRKPLVRQVRQANREFDALDRKAKRSK